MIIIFFDSEGSSGSLTDTPSPGKKTPSEYEYVQLDELEVLATLGMGGFGRVELVCRRLNFFHTITIPE